MTICMRVIMPTMCIIVVLVQLRHCNFCTIITASFLRNPGIGIDDTFILLSGIADACHITEGPGDTPIEKKMYFALKHSGVAITITSITDFLAFAIGATSTFLSVQNFCLYTGKFQCHFEFCFKLLLILSNTPL